MFEYYYNDVPGIGKTRNNLIYTSLISSDKKTFIQWYYNDSEYHKGQNEVVEPSLMQEKFNREIKYLLVMKDNYPDLVPNFTIDKESRKIYLDIDGADFWNRSNCSMENYDEVLPDWQDQMLEILHAHSELGIHKYSMHPSSYFVVGGKLKSINYFFAYDHSEPYARLKDVQSHIHSNRQEKMKQYLDKLGIDLYKKYPFATYDILCWNSFRDNYPTEFIEKALKIVSKD